MRTRFTLKRKAAESMNKIQTAKKSLEEQQHQADIALKDIPEKYLDVCVRGRQVEQTHGKDIRTPEELES